MAGLWLCMPSTLSEIEIGSGVHSGRFMVVLWRAIYLKDETEFKKYKESRMLFDLMIFFTILTFP